jgi:hypothetical protein
MQRSIPHAKQIEFNDGWPGHFACELECLLVKCQLDGMERAWHDRDRTNHETARSYGGRCATRNRVGLLDKVLEAMMMHRTALSLFPGAARL